MDLTKKIPCCAVRERRRSRGEVDQEDEDEQVEEDPKIQREMDEISKIKDESGIGKVIFQELSELKQKPPKPVDPWKASRVPSAKYEPRYHTRYQSPMFACKSGVVLMLQVYESLSMWCSITPATSLPCLPVSQVLY